ALGPDPSPEVKAAAEPFLFTASPPYSEADEKRMRHADLLVSLPAGPGITEFRPADTMPLLRPEALVRAVLARRQDLRVALGRRRASWPGCCRGRSGCRSGSGSPDPGRTPWGRRRRWCSTGAGART